MKSKVMMFSAQNNVGYIYCRSYFVTPVPNAVHPLMHLQSKS